MSDQRVRDVFGGGVTSEKGSGKFSRHGAARRREEAALSSQQRREQLLRQKRFNTRRADSTCEPAAAVHGGISDAGTGELANERCAQGVGPAVTALRAAVSAALGSGGTIPADAQATLVGAVRALRATLSECASPPCAAAIDAGAIDPLIALLNSSSAPLAIEAAWCLTNITASDYAWAGAEQHARARETIATTVPHLVIKLTAAASALSGTVGLNAPPSTVPASALQLAEHCAWALGNIAGDCQELRTIVAKAGALGPLTALATCACAPAHDAPPQGSGPGGGHGRRNGFVLNLGGADAIAAGAVQTGAWALSNLVRGNSNGEVGHVLGLESAAERITCGLSAPSEIATEFAWILTYCTAGEASQVNQLVKAGLSEAVLAVIKGPRELGKAYDGGGDAGVSSMLSRALITPLIRIIGNVAGCGASQIQELLCDAHGTADVAPPVVLDFLRSCLHAGHRAIQKEAAWALSNIASSSEPSHLHQVKRVCLEDLCALVVTSQFDIRREAAFVVRNLCAANGGDAVLIESVLSEEMLQSFLSLVRAPDVSAAELGLQLIELVLRCVPNGPKLVEEVDGIDAIEQQHFSDVERLRVRSKASCAS